ncbi:hypothetical protein QTP88_029750 [Uroleucon formosanum]
MAEVLRLPEDERKRTAQSAKQKAIKFGRTLVGKKAVISKAIIDSWHRRKGRKVRPITNGVESFHRTYNGQFYSTHSPTHVVISVLKETQTQTVAIMKSIENNIIKTMASKDYDLNLSTINSYKEFEQTKDIMRYLKLTGNKYLGKQN